jgi:hypothetical protein
MGSNGPPTIVVPREGTTITGNTIISASAAPWARRVEYLISGWPLFYLAHLGDATESRYGWAYPWGSQRLPDGKYWVKARAYDPLGNHVDGPQIEVTVQNGAGGYSG